MESVRQIINKDLSCEIKFRVSIEAIVKLSKIQSINDNDLSLGELFEKLLECYSMQKSYSPPKQKRTRHQIKDLKHSETNSPLEAPRIVRRNISFSNEQVYQRNCA